jgi:hypothetical protein
MAKLGKGQGFGSARSKADLRKKVEKDFKEAPYEYPYLAGGMPSEENVSKEHYKTALEVSLDNLDTLTAQRIYEFDKRGEFKEYGVKLSNKAQKLLDDWTRIKNYMRENYPKGPEYEHRDKFKKEVYKFINLDVLDYEKFDELARKHFAKNTKLPLHIIDDRYLIKKGIEMIEQKQGDKSKKSEPFFVEIGSDGYDSRKHTTKRPAPSSYQKKRAKDKAFIDSVERGFTRIDNFRVGQVVREWSKHWKRFVGEHIVVKKDKTHTKVVTIEPRLTVHEFANSYDKFNFLGNLTDVYTRSFKSDKDGPKQDHFYFEVQVPKGKTETFGGYAINSKNKESFKLVEKALETSSKSSKAQPKSKATKKSAMGKKIDLAIGDLVDLLAVTDSPKLKDKIEKALKDLKELKKMY